MLFNSIPFIIFFAVVMSAQFIFKNQRIRRIILLVASYFFYGYWDWRFLSLILLSTCVDYYAGSKIYKTEDKKKRKRYLLISLVTNLGLLGFFKYFNFFIESANSVFGAFGLNLSTLNIILPVGISFYTFQTLSYTIDIYRHRLKPTSSFLNFAVFVAFFPQLVAGPIVRAKEFLPQIERGVKFDRKEIQDGLQIFIFGMIKKVLIADRLAFFVDKVFDAPVVFNSLTVWLSVIAYSIQIYCDFSGYSDMAIGLAKCMGFDLPINFKMPYVARNITEFWRRWHITLSTWLRDYLYIPLGGNKKGEVKTYINLMITMLLGGLWHGASWNFVIWGGIHGAGLAVHKFILKKRTKLENKNRIITGLSMLFTYMFVITCWVFFRSQSLETSMVVLKKMYLDFAPAIEWLYTPLLFIIPIVIISHIVGQLNGEKYPIVDIRKALNQYIILFILFGLFFLAPVNPAPFIYFQF